jgi:hypothetical protein
MDCCDINKNKKDGGALKGIFYGILPHSFCIGFVVFSVLGATGLVAVFKNIMIIPYFFQILIALSFIMATFSAFLYLKKCDCLHGQGIKNKWKYLTILYGTTIFINLFMFSFVFPALANINSKNVTELGQTSQIILKVDIPCTGHAPLIIDELKKDSGVKNVNFKSPNTFEINYNPNQTSVKKIESTNIFKTYKVENIKTN